MVASIGKVASASGGTKYYESDGYYTKDSEAHLQASAWQGKGAEELGLQGNVDSEQFKSVLEGYVGDTGKRLGRMRAGEFEHKPGTDVTFSAPKSVSLAALVDGDRRILAAQDKAVAKTVQYLEENVLESRATNPETGNLERIGNQKMVAATFRHEASRNLDPQLHTHVVIANMGQGEDGKWRAIENHSLYDNQKTLGAIYRNNLAAELMQLGYEIDKTHSDGRFEIAGYSKKVLDAFSTRSQDIKNAMRQLDYGSDPALAAKAALLTRTRKKEPERGELHAIWQERAKELDMDSKSPPIKNVNGIKPDATEAVKYAIAHLEERNSSFETRDLIASALAFAPGVNSVAAIKWAIENARESGRLVDATTLPREGFTTDHTLVAEKENIERMQNGKNAVRAMLSRYNVDKALVDTNLTAGQKKAIENTFTSPDKITAIQGYAGSGKTTMLNMMREIAEKENAVNVIGLAPSASAAQTLEQESGIASHTLQSFLAKNSLISEGRDNEGTIFNIRQKENTTNTMIVVDEASLASTNQVRDLLKITEKLGYRHVLLVGDAKQLDAVDAGTPFQQLQNAGIATTFMTEIMRQRDPKAKEAVAHVLNNAPAAAINTLGENVIETPKDDMASTAANAWLLLSPDERDKTDIIAPTHYLREGINDTIRDQLANEGRIHGEGVHFERFDSLRFTQAERELTANYCVGSMVVFNSNIRSAGIEAGDVFRVIGIEDGEVLMVDNDGRQVSINPDGGAASRIDVFEAKDMELRIGDQIRWTRNNEEHDLINNHQAEVVAINGDMVHFSDQDGREIVLSVEDAALHHCDYAFNSTVHSFQGQTQDNVIAVLDANHQDLTNQKTFYVEVSRARDGITIITDNKEQLAATLEANTGEQFSALKSIDKEPSANTESNQRLEEAVNAIFGEGISLTERNEVWEESGLPEPDERDYSDEQFENYDNDLEHEKNNDQEQNREKEKDWEMEM